MPNIKTIYSEIKTLTPLLAKNLSVKKFPSLLESEFQHDYVKKTYNLVRLTLIVGYILFAAGNMFVFAFIPDWRFTFSIIMGVVTPVILILLILCFTKLFFVIQQAIIFIYAIVILMGFAIIAAVIPLPYKDLVYQGMLLPALFIMTLGHLQFRYSIYILILVMVFSNISYYFSGFLAAHNYYSFLGNNYFLFASVSLCLAASYFYESTRRKLFLYSKFLTFKNELLEYQNYYDDVTEVPNKRYFDNTLDTEWRRAMREKKSLAFIFVDLDYFRQYNDLYGHTLGDKVLHSVAQALQMCARRAGDFVARYRDDEFAVLLPNTSFEGVLEVAKIMQSAINDLQIEHAKSEVSNFLTVTMGATAIIPTTNMKPTDLLHQANMALNRGKSSQRNTINSH